MTAGQPRRRLGGREQDVVRTRMYVTHRRDCDAVGKARGEVFATHPPVSTLVVVAGLIHPDMRVEIEVEAVVSNPSVEAPTRADP